MSIDPSVCLYRLFNFSRYDTAFIVLPPSLGLSSRSGLGDEGRLTHSLPREEEQREANDRTVVAMKVVMGEGGRWSYKLP